MGMKYHQKQAFVIGQNIAHSKSPLIHNYWLQKYNIQGRYDIRDFDESELPNFVKEVRTDENITGFNITIPYKQAIIPFLDEIEDTAQTIGAVNTVYKKSNKLIGTNTDAYGFMQNLKDHVKSNDFNALKTQPVLLYGAGGAAKAVLYGLVKDGFTHIDICNRTLSKTKNLAQRHKNKASIRVIDGLVKNVENHYVTFINTTSLGMAGHQDLEISFADAASLRLVVDIVYKPLYTDILRKAQKADIQIVTGIGMLLHQARPAFAKFFGHIPDIDKKLRELVLE